MRKLKVKRRKNGKDIEEEFELEDKDFLLIEAINNLTQQLRIGNRK